MGSETRAPYGETDGVRLLRELARAGLAVFTVGQARECAAVAGVHPGYIDDLLLRLVHAGWLIRLKRGLYARGELLPGEARIHPFAVATQLVRPSAISHFSALNHHGLTEQLPRIVTAFTSRKVVTPSMRAGEREGRGRHVWEAAGVRCEYVTVRAEHFFGIEEVWVDERFKVPITDRERTALELFISIRRFGGMGETLGILEGHIQEFDLERLIGYAVRYGMASVAKRLGWALERFGVSETLLAPLLDMPVKGVRALDPTQPLHGPCDRRWMIQNNLLERSGS